MTTKAIEMDDVPVNTAASQEDLAVRVARVLGQESVVLENLPPGSSRGAVRVMSSDGQPIAFLRIDLGVETAVTVGKALEGEVALLRRARELGFPVPEVFALLDNPVVAVMELAAGTSRPDEAEAERVGPEFMAHIARLHQVAPAEFGLSAPATVSQAIAQDLDNYVADANARGIASRPLVRLAARILRHTLPKTSEPPAMLHGDVGAGNFMADNGRVSAILDWELAHAGDIHEDLAWLWTRGAHTAFGDPRQRIAEYELAAGKPLDRERLAWHVAFVTFKSVIGLQRRMHTPGEDPGLLIILIASITYETLLCVALARILGIRLDVLDEVPVETGGEPVRLIELARLLTPPANREAEVLHDYLRAEAAQRDWNARRLREDSKAHLDAAPEDLDSLVDGAPPERFADLLRVMGAVCGRRCKSLPNSERRVRRAMAIGLGEDA